MAHRLLEHADRARQRADLVAALAERHGDVGVAGGDRFGHAVMSPSGRATLREIMNTPATASMHCEGRRAALSSMAVQSMPFVDLRRRLRCARVGVDAG